MEPWHSGQRYTSLYVLCGGFGFLLLQPNFYKIKIVKMFIPLFYCRSERRRRTKWIIRLGKYNIYYTKHDVYIVYIYLFIYLQKIGFLYCCVGILWYITIRYSEQSKVHKIAHLLTAIVLHRNSRQLKSSATSIDGKITLCISNTACSLS